MVPRLRTIALSILSVYTKLSDAVSAFQSHSPRLMYAPPTVSQYCLHTLRSRHDTGQPYLLQRPKFYFKCWGGELFHSPLFSFSFLSFPFLSPFTLPVSLPIATLSWIC